GKEGEEHFDLAGRLTPHQHARRGQQDIDVDVAGQRFQALLRPVLCLGVAFLRGLSERRYRRGAEVDQLARRLFARHEVLVAQAADQGFDPGAVDVPARALAKKVEQGGAVGGDAGGLEGLDVTVVLLTGDDRRTQQRNREGTSTHRGPRGDVIV